MLSLLFIFLNFPVGSLLNACDAQKKNTRNMAIVMASSLLLNMILITRWQAAGASATVLATNFLMFVLGVVSVKKIVFYRLRQNLQTFLKALAASLIMGLLIYIGKAYLNIFIVTILGGCVYFYGLFLFGGFSRADIASVAKSLGRRPAAETISSGPGL